MRAVVVHAEWAPGPGKTTGKAAVPSGWPIGETGGTGTTPLSQEKVKREKKPHYPNIIGLVEGAIE